MKSGTDTFDSLHINKLLSSSGKSDRGFPFLQSMLWEPQKAVMKFQQYKRHNQN